MKNLLLKQIEADIRRKAKESAACSIKSNIELARQVAKVCGLLAQAGIPITLNSSNADSGYIELKTDQLVAARHALGQFEHSRTEPGEDDRHVEVTLRCKEFRRVRITYQRMLPEGSKCKIQTVTNTYTTRSLCCSR
jgi:hypothetical protein